MISTPIYNLISALGTLVTDIVTGAFAFFKKYVFETLKKLILNFIKYNKKSFSSAKTFILRAIAFILVVSIISGIIIFINTKSTKISATAVIFNGETIAYIQNADDAEKIEQTTLKKLIRELK